MQVPPSHSKLQVLPDSQINAQPPWSHSSLHDVPDAQVFAPPLATVGSVGTATLAD